MDIKVFKDIPCIFENKICGLNDCDKLLKKASITGVPVCFHHLQNIFGIIPYYKGTEIPIKYQDGTCLYGPFFTPVETIPENTIIFPSKEAIDESERDSSFPINPFVRIFLENKNFYQRSDKINYLYKKEILRNMFEHNIEYSEETKQLDFIQNEVYNKLTLTKKIISDTSIIDSFSKTMKYYHANHNNLIEQDSKNLPEILKLFCLRMSPSFSDKDNQSKNLENNEFINIPYNVYYNSQYGYISFTDILPNMIINQPGICNINIFNKFTCIKTVENKFWLDNYKKVLFKQVKNLPNSFSTITSMINGKDCNK